MPKKIFRPAVRIIIIFILSAAAILLTCYILYKINEKKEYNAVLDYFRTVCEYVEQNQEVFTEFSEYQISLLEDTTDSFYIKPTGEYQERRDIYLKYAHWSNVSFSSREKNLGTVMCGIDCYDYDITIVYGNDIVNKYNISGDEQCCVIDDNIYIYIEKDIPI